MSIKLGKHFTGVHEIKLEETDQVQSCFKAFLQNQIHLDEKSIEGFALIRNFLISKSDTAISPISQAKYSALMVFESENGLTVFSGSNIDPDSKEDLKISEKRNCAETQAVTAAQQSGFSLDNLVLMFLYRKPEATRSFAAEKLLPCLDCHKKYLSSLVSNHGKLILLLEDTIYRDFLPPTFSGKNGNQIQEVSYGSHKINYIAFDAMRMLFLNIEKKLGARVCEL